MSDPSTPAPKEFLSSLSVPAMRRPRSPSPGVDEDEEDEKSTRKRKSKRRRFYEATRLVHRSSSSESEDAPQDNKSSSAKENEKSWKVKISNHTAPPEQEERYVRTHERVNDVVHKILGYGTGVARDVAELSASVLQFTPIVGLGPAAEALVCIWNSLELVETNQLACLCLTERCVDMLIILRDEIAEAGEDIEAQLQFPVMQLNQYGTLIYVLSFEAVRIVLEAQAYRPFYKRYLKRRKIQSQIEECDAKISNALDLFSLKIQIRSLKRLEAAEARRRASELRTRRDLAKVLASLPEKMRKRDKLSLSHRIVAEVEPGLDERGAKSADGSHPEEPNEPEDAASNSMTASDIRKRMDDLLLEQNNRDFALDLAELRELMREALERSSDDELLDVLQINHEEVRDVLKEMQHALDEVRASESADDRNSPSSRSVTAIPVHLNAEASLVRSQSGARTSVEEQRDTASSRPDMKEEQTIPDSAASTLSIEADNGPMAGISRANTLPAKPKLREQDISDELDRSFIEASIKALRRTRSI